MIDPNIENVLLVLILVTGFLVRLPYNNFPIDEDFGMLTYPAYFWKKGIRLIRDYWGGVPPTMFYIYFFAQKVFGNKVKHVRYFSNFYNLLNILAVFLVTDYLFGSSAALTAALIYVIFSASPYLGAYSCNAEGFYILPLTLGIFSIAHGITDNQTIYYLWGGAFIAAAFIFKLVNIVYWFSFTVYLFFLQLYKETLYFSFSFIAVAALYTLTMMVIYRGWNRQLWNQNQIRYKATLNFIKTNLKNNYKFDFPPIWKETGSIFLLSSLYLIYLFSIERSVAENILIIWTLSAFVILVSQRVYLMYHFIPLVQSASVLSGLAIYKLSEIHTLYPYYLSLPMIFPFIYFLAFNIYRKFSFFIQYKKDKRLLYFQKADQFLFIPEIAKYIREHTSSNDYIYIWGPFVQMYRLADRRSCEGFIFHFVRPYKQWSSFLFDEILNGIISKNPVYIVLIRPDFDMNVLKQITGLRYDLERVFFNRYPAYRLKKKVANPLNINRMTCEEKIKWLELLTPGSMDYKIDETYIKTGQYEKAFNEFQEALKLYPNDILTRFGLADLMRLSGKYEDAMIFYRQIEELDSRREWLHLEMGLTFGKMGKYDEAISELEKEERLFPGKAETNHGLGIIFNYQKKYADAMEMFQKSLNKDLSMEWVHLDRGLTLSEMGKYENAIFELQEEERLFPGKAETKNGLGVIYKHQKKHETAIIVFREALKINPSFLLAKYNLYSVLGTAGKYEEAEKGFFEILSNGSLSVSLKGSCCFHLGKIYLKEENLKSAKNYFTKCLEFIPGHCEAGRYLDMLEKTSQGKD